MKKSLFLLTAFLLLGITTIFPTQSATSQTTCPDGNPYCENVFSGDPESRFENIRDKYHRRVNEALNKQIATISGTSFRCDQNFEDIKIETDISVVSAERYRELSQYKQAVGILRERVAIDIPVERLSDLQTALQSVETLQKVMEQEVDIAENALTIALNSYAEMRILYPLHKELECLIPKLQELRDAWYGLVYQVSRMPRKFINAAEICS